MVTSETLKHCNFLALRVVPGYHPTRIKTVSTIFKYKFVKFNPQINRNIVVPTVCVLSKQNISHIIHQCFGIVSIFSIKRMARKVIMEVLPTNIPDLKISLTYFPLYQGN